MRQSEWTANIIFIYTHESHHNPFPQKTILISIITKYQNGGAKPP